MESMGQEGTRAQDRRRARRRRQFGLMFLAVGLFSLGPVAAKKGVSGNTTSRSTHCNAFQGVFRDLGRYTPAHPIGVPVPGIEPYHLEFLNYRLLGRDLVGCYPDCDGPLRLDSRETSFALSYRDGVLRWATVHSPSGEVAARGERPWTCKDGRLVASSSGWFSGLPHGILAFGKTKEKNYLVINDDGWLVAFDKRSAKGTVFLIVPTFGSTTANWMEFPLDEDLQRNIEALFEDSSLGSSPIDTKVVGATLRKPEDSPASTTKKRSTVGKIPIGLSLRKGELRRVDDLLIVLEEVAVTKRKDNYFDTSATLRVSQDGETRTVRLARDHSGAAPMRYVQVFNREICLEIGNLQRHPHEARIWILPVRSRLPQANAETEAVHKRLFQDQATAMGDIVLTLESADHEGRDIVVDDDLKVTIVAQTVTITAQKGDLKESIQLRRDHTDKMVFEHLFDRQIALEYSVLYNRPRQATAEIWLREPRPNLQDSR